MPWFLVYEDKGRPDITRLARPLRYQFKLSSHDVGAHLDQETYLKAYKKACKMWVGLKESGFFRNPRIEWSVPLECGADVSTVSSASSIHDPDPIAEQ